jgi:hypothetical protein
MFSDVIAKGSCPFVTYQLWQSNLDRNLAVIWIAIVTNPKIIPLRYES